MWGAGKPAPVITGPCTPCRSESNPVTSAGGGGGRGGVPTGRVTATDSPSAGIFSVSKSAIIAGQSSELGPVGSKPVPIRVSHNVESCRP